VSRLYIRAAARRDLVEHAVYLTAEGGEELAGRFLSQAEASCALLLDQPELGSPLVVRDPALISIRKWPVKDFESFLIFYVPHKRGVTIVRVLHCMGAATGGKCLVWCEERAGPEAYPSILSPWSSARPTALASVSPCSERLGSGGPPAAVTAEFGKPRCTWKH
jgi:toxin ParE1/3/4